MALSDYSVVCFDDKGVSCEASVAGFKKDTCAFVCKTYIVLEKKGVNLAIINFGEICTGGFKVLSDIGKTAQRALYFLIEAKEDTWGEYDWRYRFWKFFWHRDYFRMWRVDFFDKINRWVNAKWGKYIIPEKRFITGVACYGYDDCYDRYLRKLGILDVEVRTANEDLEEGMTYTGCRPVEGGKPGEYTTHIGISSGGKHWEVDVTEEEMDKLQCQWVGVIPETLDDYFEWVEEVLRTEYIMSKEEIANFLTKIKEGAKLQYNQGDAYIAEHFGVDTPASKVGDPVHDPVLIQAINQMNKGE